MFFGWTGFYALFVLGAMFWLETLIATAVRYRNTPARETSPAPGEASGDPGRPGHDVADSLSLDPARSRGALVLLGVPGRCRRPELDHPLPL